jgi:hypothetical protein
MTVIFQREKVMLEKLYVGCSKVYLFGLENGLMGCDEGGSVKRKKEMVGVMDAPDDLPKRVPRAVLDECNQVGVKPGDNR